MYLSYLLINVGDNPDRPRPGRLWLRNMYHVHQRLCMAFPSRDHKENDTRFLEPYSPDDFPITHVHLPRSSGVGFLFRVDPIPGGSPIITVQSAVEPDWEYAFQNAGYLLAHPPIVNDFDPRFPPNQRLAFRLRANPVRRASSNSRDSEGNTLDAKWHGKRIPVPFHQLDLWLSRHAERPSSGFKILTIARKTTGYVYLKKKETNEKSQRLFSVLFEGYLEVTDTHNLATTLARGIGPAKAFGFGLLSVKPLKDTNQ